MPLEANATEIAFIKHAVFADAFQTKDLFNSLNHYLVDEYGRFFSLNVSEFDQTIDKQEYIHQHIECYMVVNVDDEKFWLNYDIKFTDGILSHIKVLEWKKIKMGLQKD